MMAFINTSQLSPHMASSALIVLLFLLLQALESLVLCQPEQPVHVVCIPQSCVERPDNDFAEQMVWQADVQGNSQR